MAWALASGDIMWSIHMYMQFGCAASLAIIQVSDHPVALSRLDRLRRSLRRDEAVDLVLPGGADDEIARLEVRDLVAEREAVPEQRIVSELLRQQRDGGVELLLRAAGRGW